MSLIYMIYRLIVPLRMKDPYVQFRPFRLRRTIRTPLVIVPGMWLDLNSHMVGNNIFSTSIAASFPRSEIKQVTVYADVTTQTAAEVVLEVPPVDARTDSHMFFTFLQQQLATGWSIENNQFLQIKSSGEQITVTHNDIIDYKAPA